MSESGTAPSPVTGISEAALQRLVDKGRGRDDRTVSIDEVVPLLGDLDPTPDVVESVRASLAEAGITLDDGDVDLSTLTDEVLTAPAEPAGTGRGDRGRRPRPRPSTRTGDDDLVERRAPGPLPHRHPRDPAPQRRRPAAPPTRCACTSRRSAGSRCSPGREEVDPGQAHRGGHRRRRAPRRPRRRRRARRRSTLEERRQLDPPRPRRRGRQGRAHPGQPAPRRVDRQALRRPGHAASSTSSRRATSASCGRSRSSTTPRASSSPPTPRGGSARPSPGPSPTRPAPSASRCTWSSRSTRCTGCSAR